MKRCSQIFLLIDTTHHCCQVGLYGADNGRVLAHKNETMHTGHGERLIPMIDEVCQDAMIELDDIERIITLIGPGSFTGVRVCVSTARALALGLNIQSYGVSNFEALATSPFESDLLAVLLDARRDHLYVQLFNQQGAIEAPKLIAIEQCSAYFETFLGAHKTLCLIGHGIEALQSPLNISHAITLIDNQPHHPTLEHLYKAHCQQIKNHQDILCPPFPYYLREADAKKSTKVALHFQKI